MRKMSKKFVQATCVVMACAMMVPSVAMAATLDEVEGQAPALEDVEEDDVTKLFGEVPVALGAEKTAGFNNANDVTMDLIGRYSAQKVDADGGVMEIIAYNNANGFAYAINGASGKLVSFDMKTKTSVEFTALNAVETIDVKSLVQGFTYDDMTSISVSPDGTKLAVALQAAGTSENGKVAVFTCGADGKLTFFEAFGTGVQPDMVKFADDNTILTADEGEPRDGYALATDDPKGSVTVVKLDAGTSKVVTFDKYDEQRDALVAKNVILKGGEEEQAMPSRDLEPEYISVTNGKAYISLQENNAIAVLDLEPGKEDFTDIFSVGFVDYGTTPIDLDTEDGEYVGQTYPGVLGIRMPDGITTYDVDGTTYLVTANEGDGREYEWDGGDYATEKKVKLEDKDSLNGNITAGTLESKVTFFVTDVVDGLDDKNDYLFGGRSFTIFKVTDNGLEVVFDSAADISEKTAAYLPDYYNVSNDNTEVEDRTGKKGPEPETVIVGQIGEKTYAFVAIERTSGVMMYDVTTPDNAKFVNYINSRDFENVVSATWEEDDGEVKLDKWVNSGDVAPEGLAFIAAEDSANGYPMLLASNEVSGTVSAYKIGNEKYVAPVVTHDVTVESDGNGTVTADPTTAEAGREITLTVTANEGYEFDAWVSDVTITDNTFTMPASDVTIKATFKAVKEESKPETDKEDKPEEGTDDSDKNTSAGDEPKTGDSTNMVLWVMALMLAGASAIGVSYKVVKNKR